MCGGSIVYAVVGLNRELFNLTDDANIKTNASTMPIVRDLSSSLVVIVSLSCCDAFLSRIQSDAKVIILILQSESKEMMISESYRCSPFYSFLRGLFLC